MSEKDDGGQAFPRAEGEITRGHDGMSLRDWLAGKAMSGLLFAIPESCKGRDVEEHLLAEAAYEIADAMLEARKK